MPLVIVEMWQGRTIEQKKQLAEGITSAFARIGAPPEQVNIIFRITPSTTGQPGGNWPQKSPKIERWSLFGLKDALGK